MPPLIRAGVEFGGWPTGWPATARCWDRAREGWLGKRNYLRDPSYWLRGLRDRRVDGLISAYLGFVLHRTVVKRAEELRRPVVEVGAFKGLSTVFLSNACAKWG